MEGTVKKQGKEGIIQELEDGRLLVEVDKSVYAKEAILTAAYKFTGACYVHLDSKDSDHYGVYFFAKQPDADLRSQAERFCNELIDEQVRQNLDKSNKAIKEMIIKKAFFPFPDNEGQ